MEGLNIGAEGSNPPSCKHSELEDSFCGPSLAACVEGFSFIMSNN